MAAPTRNAESVVGSDRPNVTGTLKVVSGLGVASGLVLISANGTEVVIWARNDGKLYGGTRANFATPEAAGSALW